MKETDETIERASETTDWDMLERMLQNMAKEQNPARAPILSDIFKATIKLAKESHGTLNLKITATVLKELRYSFKMFYPHRGVSKITMFGSARVPPGTELYELAKSFAVEAVKKKFMILTGGGPGIMAAGNEGAQSKGGFGLNIRLPVEQTPNPFIDQKEMLIHYKYFFIRKLFLVKEACAFVFFPGGFGTFDEAFEVLTLLQTGKTSMIPVVMLEPKGFGFWEELVHLLQKGVLTRGFISASDSALYQILHTPADTLRYIEKFYENYHSMRFVRENLVLRVKKPIGDAMLTKIQKQFGALCPAGKFKVSAPLPEEANEPELKDMPRLVFPFDRKDYGSLRRLIDFINGSTV